MPERQRERRALGVSESEAERERVTVVLRHHYASGRLSLDEFRSRVDDVYAAESVEAMRRGLRGLAAPPLTASTRQLGRAISHPGFLVPLGVFGSINLFCVGIWVLAGAGKHVFWPLWVMLCTAFVLSLAFVGIYFGKARRERPELPRGRDENG